MSKAKVRRDAAAVRAKYRLSRHAAVRNIKLRTRYKLSPDEVCAVIHTHIREALGDRADNLAVAYAHSGFFRIHLSRVNIDRVRDTWWRLMLREGINLRRESLGLVFRVLRGVILTDV